MKTKFILHGGFSKGEKQENDDFFKEILVDTPNEVKILLVYFAKEADRISINREEDIGHFNKNKGNRIVSFEVADEKDFLEQVRISDIIYLHGGSSAKLLETLKYFPDLKKLFDGKIIAGDSAGTNVLAAVFYSHVADKVSEGLGIIPIKIICHFSDMYKNKLDGYVQDLETLFLSEFKFKTLYQDLK